MRFLILTAPTADRAPLDALMRQSPRTVKVVSYTARSGSEGVGVLDAPSRFDAEQFARRVGAAQGAEARLLPL